MEIVLWSYYLPVVEVTTEKFAFIIILWLNLLDELNLLDGMDEM